jgi:hypothetical protein
MFSLTAKKKTLCPIDDSDFTFHPEQFIGTEDGFNLAQENDKAIRLETGYKWVYREYASPTGRITVRQRYVISENPQTTPQQENRGKFRDGVHAWQALTMTEQVVWNKINYPENMSGYNRFLRKYMKDLI